MSSPPTFDPNTIGHLGFRMQLRFPDAVHELVAKACDADATSVSVALDTSGSQNADVTYDGHSIGR